MKSISKQILEGKFELISYIKSKGNYFLDLKLFDGINTYNGICHESSEHKLDQAKIYNILFEISTDCRVPVTNRRLNVLEINKYNNRSL